MNQNICSLLSLELARESRAEAIEAVMSLLLVLCLATSFAMCGASFVPSAPTVSTANAMAATDAPLKTTLL